MVRKSLTAVEYRAREAHLLSLAIHPGETLGGPGDLLAALEGLGVGLDDVTRVLLLAHHATERTLPATIDDACAHYRIGVFQLANRRWAAGAQLGAYHGCVFLAWSV